MLEGREQDVAGGDRPWLARGGGVGLAAVKISFRASRGGAVSSYVIMTGYVRLTASRHWFPIAHRTHTCGAPATDLADRHGMRESFAAENGEYAAYGALRGAGDERVRRTSADPVSMRARRRRSTSRGRYVGVITGKLRAGRAGDESLPREFEGIRTIAGMLREIDRRADVRRAADLRADGPSSAEARSTSVSACDAQARAQARCPAC